MIYLFVLLSDVIAQQANLPNPLVLNDGTQITSAEIWYNLRRPELLKLFETNIYGKTPGKADSVESNIQSSKLIMDGKAKMNQVELKVFVNQKFIVLNLLEIIPANAKKPLACFVGLNFDGNQTVLPDTSIRITDKWLIGYNTPEIVNNHATEASRGSDVDKWCARLIVDHGYALITCNSADIDEDRINYTDGAQAFFYKNSQNKPKTGEWATIGAWAWGLSRILDYIETNPVFNSKKVIAFGHSRLGKTALWSAAQDTRFAAVISNNSGCGGAAVFRNKKGEQIADINRVFPYWFNDKFKEFNNNENSLPVDQHELIALMAPRPVYVASASNDQWAGPENEFLAINEAIPVYQLLEVRNIPQFKKPVENVPQIGILSYHLRKGKHDVTPWDWENYLKFADLIFK